MILGVSKWFYIASVLLALLFVFFPQIDIATSALFYDENQRFFWAKSPLVLFIYEIPRVITLAAIIALLILIADMILKKRLLNIRPLLIFYFVATMIVGPGLIVHELFKNQWGRARPSKIVVFGGKREFTPAFVISDQCERNCSFVSGHAAGGFSLVALALLAHKRRRLAMGAALTIGSIVGLGRIIQGGHFLSDVIFAFVFVYLTAKIFYYYTFEKRAFDFIDQRSAS